MAAAGCLDQEEIEEPREDQEILEHLEVLEKMDNADEDCPDHEDLPAPQDNKEPKAYKVHMVRELRMSLKRNNRCRCTARHVWTDWTARKSWSKRKGWRRGRERIGRSPRRRLLILFLPGQISSCRQGSRQDEGGRTTQINSKRSRV